MDSPTSQSVASYLSNHMGFQSWLAQHVNQDIASLHNDPELSKFREEYNQNLNLGKLRTDPAQNTNIDINTFMQGVEMVKNMGNQVTAQMMNKQMDHAAYPESLKTKSDQQLRFIMKDAYEAMKANPDNPNNGYYQDEINYCANEINRRQRGVKAQISPKVGDYKVVLGDSASARGVSGLDPNFEKEYTVCVFTDQKVTLNPNKKGTPYWKIVFSGSSEMVDFFLQSNNISPISDIRQLNNNPPLFDRGANKKQAQQGSNLDQLVANVNKSLLVAQNSLVDLVELLNQGFIGGGGESVDTNVPSSEEQGASGRLEHLSEVARQVLPQIEQAAQVFQSEMKYFSSFSAPQQMSVGEPVISKKVSVATKYITGIKSLQEAHDKVEQVYQFANEFPYFVLNYDGFKKLCNFKTACNNLKKDIEILQKI